jgi:hypothetical protein
MKLCWKLARESAGSNSTKLENSGKHHLSVDIHKDLFSIASM